MGMNRRLYRELQETEMEEKQAIIIASHIPDWSQFATKQDMAELKAELKSEFKQGMTELKSEFKQGMAALKSEFKQDMAELRSEFKQDMAELRSEFKSGFKQDMAELKTDLIRWQWVRLGVIMALLVAWHFIPVAA